MKIRYGIRNNITFTVWCFVISIILSPFSFAQNTGQQAKPEIGDLARFMPMPMDPRAQNRTYHFEETNEDLQYCLFVSSKMKKDRKSPLIITLHGLGAEPSIMLTKEAVDLAEEGGYILVGPMGYNVRGWYGIPMGPPPPGFTKIPPKKDQPDTKAAPKPKASLFYDPNDPPNLRELSEKDVMNVLDILRKEFNVDENRIYLMGHSMGGAGTLHLGVKYASIWAALAPIAPAAFGLNPDILAEIESMPVIFVHGDVDEAVPVAMTRQWIDKLKELNMTYEYNEMSGVSHVPVITAALPSVYEFFSKHSKPELTVEQKAESISSPILKSAAKLTTEDVTAFFDGLVPLQMERDDLAGLVIVVVKDGKTLFEKGYGYADREKKRPVSVEETLFRPGSISKLFTWTAVMQLVEQGKLNLDHDVNEYLDFKIPPGFSEPITLRDIMTHTPGFEDTIKDLFVARPEDLLPLSQYLSTHLPSRIFPPGTTPAYSNYATALAGYIVQSVSGEKFEDYISAHIFQPLGMAHSTFIQPLPENLKPFMSEGYRLGSGKPQKFEIIPASPAGALSITGADIARFMIAHLQEGEYNGNHILTPATIRLMHSRQPGFSSEMNGMCLGFYEESLNGERIIGHGGDTLWFHSDLHLMLNKNLGFFISVNSAGRDGQLRGSLWGHFMDRYFPYPLAQGNPTAEKMASAKMVSRSYLTSRRSETNFLRIGSYFSELTFSANPDGTIQSKAIKALNGQPKRFEEIGPLTYREIGGQMRLAFTKEPNGEMTLNPAPIIEYKSVPWYQSQKFLTLIVLLSAIIAILTLIFWIIVARVRRHYGQSLGLVGFPRFLRFCTRIVCVFILASYIAWAVPLIRLIRDITESASMDSWFRLAQILTSISMALTIIAVINLIAVWFQKRWWWSKIWETMIGLACLAFVWFAIFGRLWERTLMY